MMDRIKTTVSIDDAFGPFDCLLDPSRRWNGWACPIFPMESVRAISEQLAIEAESMLPEETNWVIIDDEGVWFGSGMYADEYDDVRGHKAHEIVVDGVTYYNIDDGWCWTEDSTDDPNN